MIISWQVLNKVAYKQDTRYSKNILMVAPGLTVKSRLQVLDPNSEDNYYEEFNIVPPTMMEQLRQGKVKIVNWHMLAWDDQASLDEKVESAMHAADVLMVDGTFWTEDEMIRLGLSKKKAAEMGHLPQSGTGGMIEALQPYKNKRRILIHINNTNPILREDSAEHQQLKDAGIEIAYDGLTIEI
jgi:hypothetical protein